MRNSETIQFENYTLTNGDIYLLKRELNANNSVLIYDNAESEENIDIDDTFNILLKKFINNNCKGLLDFALCTHIEEEKYNVVFLKYIDEDFSFENDFNNLLNNLSTQIYDFMTHNPEVVMYKIAFFSTFDFDNKVKDLLNFWNITCLDDLMLSFKIKFFDDLSDSLKNIDDDLEKIEIYNKLISIIPYNTFYEEQAKLYLKIKENDKAIKAYYNAAYNSKIDNRGILSCSISLDFPGNFMGYASYYHHCISNIYFKARDYKNAIKEATNAIKVCPTGYWHVEADFRSDYHVSSGAFYHEGDAYADRALLYCKIQEYDKAILDAEHCEDFKSTIKLYALFKKGAIKEALAFCEKYKYISDFVRFIQGYCYELLGDLDNAKANYNRIEKKETLFIFELCGSEIELTNLQKECGIIQSKRPLFFDNLF